MQSQGLDLFSLDLAHQTLNGSSTYVDFSVPKTSCAAYRRSFEEPLFLAGSA